MFQLVKSVIVILMILPNGQRFHPEIKDILPAGSLVKMAPKGSIITQLFLDFISYLSKFKMADPILLMFNRPSDTNSNHQKPESFESLR